MVEEIAINLCLNNFEITLYLFTPWAIDKLHNESGSESPSRSHTR